jgi:hypothetical protein
MEDMLNYCQESGLKLTFSFEYPLMTTIAIERNGLYSQQVVPTDYGMGGFLQAIKYMHRELLKQQPPQESTETL